MTIDENSDGQIDLAQLERELQRYSDRPLKIGLLAASMSLESARNRGNCHSLASYGALSFWDFAAAGPYVDIEMNMVGEGAFAHMAYKDAIFISPQFIGGPGTPGILVANAIFFQSGSGGSRWWNGFLCEPQGASPHYDPVHRRGWYTQHYRCDSPAYFQLKKRVIRSFATGNVTLSNEPSPLVCQPEHPNTWKP